MITVQRRRRVRRVHTHTQPRMHVTAVGAGTASVCLPDVFMWSQQEDSQQHIKMSALMMEETLHASVSTPLQQARAPFATDMKLL